MLHRYSNDMWEGKLKTFKNIFDKNTQLAIRNLGDVSTHYSRHEIAKEESQQTKFSQVIREKEFQIEIERCRA